MHSDSKLIVNADDLGYDISVNKAILRSFERILVNSTSMMVNMSGFGDAVHLVQTHRFIANKIGLHINLTEGYALTEEIRLCKRFCDPDGQFIYKRGRLLLFLTPREKRGIYTEMKAQMDKLIGAGIQPIHLDSHHHIHTEWAVLHLLTRLGKEYGIQRIRLTRNMGLLTNAPRKIYKLFFNGYLRHASGVIGTDYFGDVEDFSALRKKGPTGDKSIEIMVHPSFNDKGELVDYDMRNLQEKLQFLFAPSHTSVY